MNTRTVLNLLHTRMLSVLFQCCLFNKMSVDDFLLAFCITAISPSVPGCLKLYFHILFCFVPLITITKMTTKPSNILSHEISLPAILLSLKCFGVKQRDLEHDSKGSPLKLSNSVWSVFTGCYHMRECPTSQHWECRMDDWQARSPHCANTWLDKPLTWVFCKMLEIRNEASTVNDSS